MEKDLTVPQPLSPITGNAELAATPNNTNEIEPDPTDDTPVPTPTSTPEPTGPTN
ncbi:hypothetical protein GCM10023085_81170 [Actinomadura viridis]